MDHGPAYVSYDSTYIVRAGSDIRSAAALDRAGVRVGAIEGTSTSRTVARSLEQASMVPFPKPDDAVEQLAQGRVDALAVGREALIDIAKRVPGRVSSTTSSDLSPLPQPRLGRYRHYKGGEYEVVGVARHSETLEALVLYRSLYKQSGYWVRPYAMFFEEIEHEGRRQPRFAFLADPG